LIVCIASQKKLDEMMEKGQRFSKLLTSAKTQIEKLRKDNEVSTEVSEKKTQGS